MIKTAQKKKFFGFTLIELLIVIAILGILAAAVLVAINPAKRTRQARDAQRKNDIGSLATELQAYYTTPGQGNYPVGDGCVPTAGGLNALTTSGGLKNVPDDPQSTAASARHYCFAALADPTEAAVWATLEDPTSSGGTTTSHQWCWRSATNKVDEVAVATPCAP